jgi:hypothetical protein
MYTMNRCFNARKTRFLAPLPKLAVSTALCLLVATAVWLPNAQAQTAQREFPKNALRAVMVVTSPPQITLNGASERLSPGARMTKKVFIKTFGCQMNEYDSDKMADVLGAAQGYEPTQNVDEADLILFNTCSVREKAQEKCFPTWAASSTSRKKAC